MAHNINAVRRRLTRDVIFTLPFAAAVVCALLFLVTVAVAYDISPLETFFWMVVAWFTVYGIGSLISNVINSLEIDE